MQILSNEIHILIKLKLTRLTLIRRTLWSILNPQSYYNNYLEVRAENLRWCQWSIINHIIATVLFSWGYNTNSRHIKNNFMLKEKNQAKLSYWIYVPKARGIPLVKLAMDFHNNFHTPLVEDNL